MTLCVDCTDRKACCVANDLYILAGIHGIAISIEHCPMRVEQETEKPSTTSDWIVNKATGLLKCADCGVSLREPHDADCPYFTPGPAQP